MKAIPLLCALVVLGTSSVRASEKTGEDKRTKGLVKKPQASAASVMQKEKNVALTGSYIKRNVRRQGVVTDGPDPVFVIDRRTIDLSGASDLSQVLFRTGFRR